jgi:hypothetical protein
MSGYAVAHLEEIDEISDGRCPKRPVRGRVYSQTFIDYRLSPDGLDTPRASRSPTSHRAGRSCSPTCYAEPAANAEIHPEKAAAHGSSAPTRYERADQEDNEETDHHERPDAAREREQQEEREEESEPPSVEAQKPPNSFAPQFA